MWVQELGVLDITGQGDLPDTDSYPATTASIDTAYGTVTSLAPPLTFSNLTLPTTNRLVAYGADAASWPSDHGDAVLADARTVHHSTLRTA